MSRGDPGLVFHHDYLPAPGARPAASPDSASPDSASSGLRSLTSLSVASLSEGAGWPCHFRPETENVRSSPAALSWILRESQFWRDYQPNDERREFDHVPGHRNRAQHPYLIVQGDRNPGVAGLRRPLGRAVGGGDSSTPFPWLFLLEAFQFDHF